MFVIGLAIAFAILYGRHPDFSAPTGTIPERPPAGLVIEKHAIWWAGGNGTEVAYFVSVRTKTGAVVSAQVTPSEYSRLRKGSQVQSVANEQPSQSP